MHLLLINQFFWPDTAPTGRFLMDLTRAIDVRQMTAICGSSDYATIDDSSKPPVRIMRSAFLRFSRDAIGRILSYGSFLAGAVLAGFRVSHPDTVVTLTTPPLTSVFGRMLKLSRGCRHFIWEMDVYPDIAVDLGALRPYSFLTTCIGALADWSRRNADGIIVLGEDMKARLVARDIPEHKIHVAENWADGSEITPRPFPAGPVVVHYSGNFGRAHDSQTIENTIFSLAADPRFGFVFSGDGSSYKRLETHCKIAGSPHVRFEPYASPRNLGAHLATGHLGLVTQLPATCGSIVPSKTYGIMAAGRPVLYVGPREATPARIIRKFDCGWQIDPGDSDSLIALLHRLEQNRSEIYEAGARARQAFEQNYDRPIGVARIARILGVDSLPNSHNLQPTTYNLPHTAPPTAHFPPPTT